MTAPALELEFSSRGAGRWRWSAWFALLVAAGLAVWLAELHAATSEELDALQARNKLLHKRLRPARAPRSAAADPAFAQKIQRANAVIEQLALPWEALFQAVEAVDPRGLGLLSLTPDAANQSLRLSGEARGMSELLDYVQGLAAQPGLSQVHLLDYETVARDGANVISFTLAATWKRS
jgi:Tfp pilus assembly protein PilN